MFKKVAISSLIYLAIISSTAQAHNGEGEISSETGKVVEVFYDNVAKGWMADLDNGWTIWLEDKDIEIVMGKEVEVTFIIRDPHDDDEFIEYKVLEDIRA